METDYITQLTESEVITLLSQFYLDPDYKDLKRIYLTKSFPEILSIDRREMSHSAFLAWLLNKDESHDLGCFPILQFMKILVQRDLLQGIERHQQKTTKTTDIASAVANENLRFDNLKVFLERCIKTKTENGRIDIVLDGNISTSMGKKELHIIIENKVYSGEHGKQTVTYFVSKKPEFKNNSIWLFVYLTPLPQKELDSLKEPQCSCKEFIQINYQDILNQILEPALERDIPQRIKFIIEEYIHSLGLPALSMETKENNYNPNTIMATTKRTTEMLKAFWEKNETLLMAALQTLVETSDDADIREKLNPAINALAVGQRRNKDKTHYTFNGEEANGKYALLKIVIPAIVNNGISPDEISKDYCKTIQDLQTKSKTEVFDELKKILDEARMTCPSAEELFDAKKLKTDHLVLSEKEYKEWWRSQGKAKEIYGKVDGGGEAIRIFNLWSYDTIDYFVYAFYKNRDKWKMDDKDIVVYKQRNE